MLNANKLIHLIAMISFSSVTCVNLAYADADLVKDKSSVVNNKGDFTNSIKLGTGVSERKAVRPDVLQVMQGNTPETQYLNLPINKAAIIRLPRPSRDVVVANPLLMDVVVRSPQELYLFAKYAGHTNAFIFDDMGRQIINLEINIGIDTKELEY
jgi:Flp pilus assembly secretin CpaC